MILNQALLNNTLELHQKEQEDVFSFSIDEMKWAAEATAECYKRIESGEANFLKLKE